MPLDGKEWSLRLKLEFEQLVFKKMANPKNCSCKNERKKFTVNRRLAKILTVKKF